MSTVLAAMGLRLAPEKTHIVSIDEGFDFLGFHLQRHTQRGSTKSYVYSYPSKKSMQSIRRRIKATTRRSVQFSPEALITRLNRMLRGWMLCFRHAGSSQAFSDLHHYLWWRMWGWFKDRHPHGNRRKIFDRYHVHRWPQYNEVRLIQPAAMHIQRYRYRGLNIATPWTPTPT